MHTTNFRNRGGHGKGAYVTGSGSGVRANGSASSGGGVINTGTVNRWAFACLCEAPWAGAESVTPWWVAHSRSFCLPGLLRVPWIV